ncbi:MAG: PilT/PilU family type 4a pilus ATPase [Candidatus Omnitrophica bacterium]|nr:PilT/PilU family type 4a pilus ATPase [Candidatus Omnitrophota bacterium]
MAKIDTFFEQLISQKGSDLHLAQGQKPKIRVHGHLKEMESSEVLSENALVDMMKEIADNDYWTRFDKTGDMDFAYSLGEKARFRANYFRQFNGYGAIFRMIPSEILTLEDLGLPDILNSFGKLSSGLVLVTGPTGSGKSTTLAAIINAINQNQNKKIVTIEEPVKFMHKNIKSIITHREVGLDTESFASGLNGALKSDVDIILVGEMRDKETIELALKAAEMGILVFGTLHTNSAAKTIDRVVDAFPPSQKNQIRTVLSNTLRGVLAQQLVRTADGNGRVAALEILLRTSALRSIIQTGDTIKLVSEIQMNGQMGMILMDASLHRLVSAGTITKEEAYLKAIDKDSFI